MGVTTQKTTRKRTSRRAKKVDQSVEKATKGALAVIDKNLAVIETEGNAKAEGSKTAPKSHTKETGAKKKHSARTRSSKPKRAGKLSALDAAAKVLAESREPMRCQQIVDVMLEKKLWSTQGKTPAATLYSALLREIRRKGKDSRFVKSDRGTFALAKGASA